MGNCRIYMKLSAWVLLFAFVAQQTSYAGFDLKSVELSVADPSIIHFNLSKSVAKIEDSFKSENQNSRTIILLQDAHTNESCQLNVAASLTEILPNEKIEYIFAEAGDGDLSLSYLHEGVSLDKRKQVAKSFLKNGEINGVEYLNLTSDINFKVWGVEDQDLYRHSVELYREIVKDREKFGAYLDKVESTANTFKSRIYNPALMEFDAKRQAYLTGKLSLTDYFDVLLNQAKILGLELDSFKALLDLQKLKALEVRIDFSKANAEQAAAVSSLSSENAEFFQVASESPNLKAGKVSGVSSMTGVAYFQALKGKISDWSSYPNLARYMDYLDLSEKIQANHVLDQLESVENSVYQGLSRSQDEKKLIQISMVLRQMKLMTRLTLTPKEFARLQSQVSEYNLTTIGSFINEKIMRFSSDYDRVVYLENGYKEFVRSAENFYHLTYLRDISLIQNMVKKMDEANVNKGVLYTGGFHTQNLKNILRSRGISYVSVTPQVLQETNQKRYEKILLGRTPESGFTKSGSLADTDLPQWIALTPDGIRLARELGVEKSSGTRLVTSSAFLQPFQQRFPQLFGTGSQGAVDPSLQTEQLRQFIKSANNFKKQADQEISKLTASSKLYTFEEGGALVKLSVITSQGSVNTVQYSLALEPAAPTVPGVSPQSFIVTLPLKHQDINKIQHEIAVQVTPFGKREVDGFLVLDVELGQDSGDSLEIATLGGNILGWNQNGQPMIFHSGRDVSGKVTKLLNKPSEDPGTNNIPLGGGDPMMGPWTGRVLLTEDNQFLRNNPLIRIVKNDQTGEEFAIHGYIAQMRWYLVDSGRDANGAYVELVTDTRDYPEIAAASNAENFSDLKITRKVYLTRSGLKEIHRYENIGDKETAIGDGAHPFFDGLGNRKDVDVQFSASALHAKSPSGQVLPNTNPVADEDNFLESRELPAGLDQTYSGLQGPVFTSTFTNRLTGRQLVVSQSPDTLSRFHIWTPVPSGTQPPQLINVFAAEAKTAEDGQKNVALSPGEAFEAEIAYGVNQVLGSSDILVVSDTVLPEASKFRDKHGYQSDEELRARVTYFDMESNHTEIIFLDVNGTPTDVSISTIFDSRFMKKLPNLGSGTRLATRFRSARQVEPNQSYLSQYAPNLVGKTIVEVTAEIGWSQALFKRYRELLTAKGLDSDEINSEVEKAALAFSVGGIGPLLSERIPALAKQATKPDGTKDARVVGTTLFYDHVWVQYQTPDGLQLIKEKLSPYVYELFEKVGEGSVRLPDTSEPVRVEYYKAPADAFGGAEVYFINIPDVETVLPGRANVVYAGGADAQAEREKLETYQRWILGRGALSLVKFLSEKKQKDTGSEITSSDLQIISSETSAMYANPRVFLDNFSTDPLFADAKFYFNDHTPLPYAHPKFKAQQLENAHVNPIKTQGLPLTEQEGTNVSATVINDSDGVFGVAQKHQHVMQNMPILNPLAEHIDGVTNGVGDDWVDPRILAAKSADGSYDLNEVLRVREENRQELLRHIAKHTGLGDEFASEAIAANRPVVTWLRRLVQYKKSDLLVQLLGNDGFRQRFLASGAIILLGGRTHQDDTYGKRLYKQLSGILEQYPDLKTRVIFYPNYNLETAPIIKRGSGLDVMTAEVNREASATGFQKTQRNGGLVAASSDGAIPESVIFYDKNNSGPSIASGANGFEVPYGTDGLPTVEGLLSAIENFTQVRRNEDLFKELTRNALAAADFVSIDRTAQDQLDFLARSEKRASSIKADYASGFADAENILAGDQASILTSKNDDELREFASSLDNSHKNRFYYNYDIDGLTENLRVGKPGFANFVDELNYLLQIGEFGRLALKHHTKNKQGEGDFIVVARDILKKNPELSGLLAKVEEYAQQSKAAENPSQKLGVNYRLIGFLTAIRTIARESASGRGIDVLGGSVVGSRFAIQDPEIIGTEINDLLRAGKEDSSKNAEARRLFDSNIQFLSGAENDFIRGELLKSLEEAGVASNLATFQLESADVLDISRRFKEQIEKRGTGEDFPKLEVRLGDFAKLKDGKYVFVDFGGTNVRADVIEVRDNKIVKSDRDIKSFTIKDFQRQGGGESVFDAIADFIDTQVVPLLADGDYTLGFTFSFDSERRGLNDVVVTESTNVKGFNFDLLRGQNVSTALQTRINKKLAEKNSRIKVNVVVNDTQATELLGLVSDKYISDSNTLGVIVGTGYNVSLRDRDDKAVSVVLESGGFSKFLRAHFDELLDDFSTNTGKHLVEKAIGGKYLGPLAGVIIATLAENGENNFEFVKRKNFPAIFDHSFETDKYRGIKSEHLSTIAALNLDEFLDRKKLAAYLKNPKLFDKKDPARLEDISLDDLSMNNSLLRQDLALVQSVARVVIKRSAVLVATSIAGSILYHERTNNPAEAKQTYTVAIDGSLLLIPGYLETINQTLRDIFSSDFIDSNVSLVEVKDGSGIGAGLTSAVVASAAGTRLISAGSQSANARLLDVPQSPRAIDILRESVSVQRPTGRKAKAFVRRLSPPQPSIPVLTTLETQQLTLFANNVFREEKIFPLFENEFEIRVIEGSSGSRLGFHSLLTDETFFTVPLLKSEKLSDLQSEVRRAQGVSDMTAQDVMAKLKLSAMSAENALSAPLSKTKEEVNFRINVGELFGKLFTDLDEAQAIKNPLERGSKQSEAYRALRAQFDHLVSQAATFHQKFKSEFYITGNEKQKVFFDEYLEGVGFSGSYITTKPQVGNTKVLVDIHLATQAITDRRENVFHVDADRIESAEDLPGWTGLFTFGRALPGAYTLERDDEKNIIRRTTEPDGEEMRSLFGYAQSRLKDNGAKSRFTPLIMDKLLTAQADSQQRADFSWLIPIDKIALDLVIAGARMAMRAAGMAA